MPGIGFRPLEVDDLQQVFLWLLKPHVSKWYSPEPSSFMECVAKYGPRTQPGNAVRAFIVSLDDAAIGYIQTYAIEAFPDYAAQLGCEPGMAGIDLFIGEESCLHRGIGPRIVSAFVGEIVFAGDTAHACIAGPGEGHRESIRAFEKAGFRRWKAVRIDDRQVECVMRRERDATRYRIAPIELARDGEACIAFRRASFVASFGSEAGLDEEMGPESALYLGRLRARIEQVPEGNAHLWDGERIVGQAEMRLHEEPGVGYVNLLYVEPSHRGLGLGRLLHDHAAEVFRKRGMRTMRLSVSTQNTAALAFYRKLGWVSIGTRPNREPMEILEFALA